MGFIKLLKWESVTLETDKGPVSVGGLGVHTYSALRRGVDHVHNAFLDAMRENQYDIIIGPDAAYSLPAHMDADERRGTLDTYLDELLQGSTYSNSLVIPGSMHYDGHQEHDAEIVAIAVCQGQIIARQKKFSQYEPFEWNELRIGIGISSALDKVKNYVDLLAYLDCGGDPSLLRSVKRGGHIITVDGFPLPSGSFKAFQRQTDGLQTLVDK